MRKKQVPKRRAATGDPNKKNEGKGYIHAHKGTFFSFSFLHTPGPGLALFELAARQYP